MIRKCLVAAAFLAAAVFAGTTASAVTFNLVGGTNYVLPNDFNPAPGLPDLAKGATVKRNATLRLSGPGKVTFSFQAREAAFTNEFWADSSKLFSNKLSGQTPVTLALGAGNVPFFFRQVSGGPLDVLNGASKGFQSSIALFERSATSVYALFNDGAGDKDYDDMVVRLDVAPVPLPAAAWLLIAAMGGLGVAARRRAVA